MAFEIGDHVYVVTTGYLDDVTIRKAKITNIITQHGKLENSAKTFFNLESTYCGRYVGTRGDYSSTGGFVKAMSESNFSEEEKNIFKSKELALQRLTDLL